MKISISILLLAILSIACQPTEDSRQEAATFDYGTSNDSARYYFFKGWEEIMDNGRWTESELAFRKAVALDPDWLLGKSLLGRITGDLEERQQLLGELEANKDKASEYEALLLEVNMLSMAAANNRDMGIKSAETSITHRTELGEKNFREFVRKYPEDSYFKAEYIELLHRSKGAKAALDALNALATDEQKKLGFYISYTANLELDLNNIASAEVLYEELVSSMESPSYTTAILLKANIYMAQDSIVKAKELVDRVVRMDPNHLVALGLQTRLRDYLFQEER